MTTQRMGSDALPPPLIYVAGLAVGIGAGAS